MIISFFTLNTHSQRGKLYRSSVTIKDDKAYGAGLVRTYSRKASMVWKGDYSATTSTVGFNAYASLENSFTLDGDWSLTSDCYFTLE